MAMANTRRPVARSNYVLWRTLQVSGTLLSGRYGQHRRPEIRLDAINRLVLDKEVFMHLFLYWSPLVQALFHHLLVYRCFLEEERYAVSAITASLSVPLACGVFQDLLVCRCLL